MLKKVLSLITGTTYTDNALRMPKNRAFRKLTERELLRRESHIGSQLFGSIQKGHQREFFCLDESTWIWHEAWIDAKGRPGQTTTRYEIHANGVLKVQEGARYEYIEGTELHNLTLAVRLYYERVAREVYGRDPQTGVKLV